MNIKKLILISGLVICCKQFASDICDIEMKEFITENDQNDNTQNPQILMNLAFNHYLNKRYTETRNVLEKVINLPTENRKNTIIAFFVLAKMYYFGKCKLSKEDKQKFSYNFETKQGAFVDNGKTERDQAKFYFEIVFEFNKYYSSKNFLASIINQKDNDFEVPEENALVSFYLAQIYNQEFHEIRDLRSKSEKEKLNILFNAHKYITSVLQNNLSTQEEKAECNQMRKVLPKLSKSLSGKNLVAYG